MERAAKALHDIWAHDDESDQEIADQSDFFERLSFAVNAGWSQQPCWDARDDSSANEAMLFADQCLPIRKCSKRQSMPLDGKKAMPAAAKQAAHGQNEV